MKAIFDDISNKTSKLTTYTYSTSFSLGIRTLHKDLRQPICSIYGFVRFADEIVDSFEGYPQETILKNFRRDTYEAIEMGISINPILNSFQQVVRKYKIEKELIDSFLNSMELDLDKKKYLDKNELKNYILGSAEVVGLMCLKVFCNHDEEKYLHLKPYAMKLGSAFQKVNFLRDLKEDYQHLGRTYFPNFSWEDFHNGTKEKIEEEIEEEFNFARKGILKLPAAAKFGVYLAFTYYLNLFNKIKRTPANRILDARVRIPNQKKVIILASTYIKHQFKLIV